MAVLQPFTGTRSTGNLTVRSSPGASAVLPDNAYAVPIIGGAIRPELTIKTGVNPASPTGWTVVAAGTAVPALSVTGGADKNLPATTKVRWWPTIDGIEAESVVAVGGLTGGAAPTGLTAVKELAWFEQLQATDRASEDFWKGAMKGFPGLALVWDASGPADNQTVSPLRRTGSRAGRGYQLHRNDWSIYVISSRLDTDAARREEGLAILDEVTGTLADRSEVDRINFSLPTGIEIFRRERVVVSKQFYIYRIAFCTVETLAFRERRTFSDWAVTRLDVDTTDTPAFPMVDNVRFPMP